MTPATAPTLCVAPQAAADVSSRVCLSCVLVTPSTQTQISPIQSRISTDLAVPRRKIANPTMPAKRAIRTSETTASFIAGPPSKEQRVRWVEY